MRRHRHAVLGGTFDHLHRGHAALLDTAFRVGQRVSIGLITDGYLAQHPKPLAERIQPFSVRRQVLHRWLRRHYPRRTWRTVPLNDGFGRSIEAGVDVLVVSSDTRAGGRAVNVERRRRGRPRIPLVAVPLVLADDLAPLSARRVRAGVVDARGRRTAPLAVRLAAPDARSRAELERAVRRAFSRSTVTFLSPNAEPPAGPSRRGSGSGTALLPELELTARRLRKGGWTLSERAGPVVLKAFSGDDRPLRAAALQLLRPDLERKAYAPLRASRRRWRRT